MNNAHDTSARCAERLGRTARGSGSRRADRARRRPHCAGFPLPESLAATSETASAGSHQNARLPRERQVDRPVCGQRLANRRKSATLRKPRIAVPTRRSSDVLFASAFQRRLPPRHAVHPAASYRSAVRHRRGASSQPLHLNAFQRDEHVARLVDQIDIGLRRAPGSASRRSKCGRRTRTSADVKSSIAAAIATRRMPTGMYVNGLNEPSSSSGTAPAIDCNSASPSAGMQVIPARLAHAPIPAGRRAPRHRACTAMQFVEHLKRRTVRQPALGHELVEIFARRDAHGAAAHVVKIDSVQSSRRASLRRRRAPVSIRAPASRSRASSTRSIRPLASAGRL